MDYGWGIITEDMVKNVADEFLEILNKLAKTTSIQIEVNYFLINTLINCLQSCN